MVGEKSGSIAKQLIRSELQMEKDKTPHKILQILKDGHFHSGEQLGHTLNMTRSAIWKGIKQLSKYGLDIQSISGRGYRIDGGLNLLNSVEISKHLPKQQENQLAGLAVLDQVSSTNDYLSKLPITENLSQPFYAALCEQQTAGRGRRGRDWLSPYGHNIYLSLRWDCQKDPFELSGLSLVIGIAIIRALKAYGIPDGAQLKWPNDILYKGKKLAGVLIEMTAEAHNKTAIIIGVGINTFLSDLQLKDINQPCTTLYDILLNQINRNRLSALLINEMIAILNVFDKDGLTPFLPEWESYAPSIGSLVTVLHKNNSIVGTMKGITEQGELILEDAQQNTHKFVSAEVSLNINKEAVN